MADKIEYIRYLVSNVTDTHQDADAFSDLLTAFEEAEYVTREQFIEIFEGVVGIG